jgi:hypothetical protein
MITLKNNKLPKIHLKLKKYKIINDNEFVTHYQKTIFTKNMYHYPKIFYINIFYHKKDNWSDVCVSLKEYIHEVEDYMYDWYSGEYEYKTMPIIAKFDKGLLKYLEEVED